MEIVDLIVSGIDLLLDWFNFWLNVRKKLPFVKMQLEVTYDSSDSLILVGGGVDIAEEESSFV